MDLLFESTIQISMFCFFENCVPKASQKFFTSKRFFSLVLLLWFLLKKATDWLVSSFLRDQPRVATVRTIQVAFRMPSMSFCRDFDIFFHLNKGLCIFDTDESGLPSDPQKFAFECKLKPSADFCVFRSTLKHVSGWGFFKYCFFVSQQMQSNLKWLRVLFPVLARYFWLFHFYLRFFAILRETYCLFLIGGRIEVWLSWRRCLTRKSHFLSFL